MNLTITNTDNAAFDGGNKGVELARILREIAEKIENGVTSGACWDINGNKVGYWSRFDDDDE